MEELCICCSNTV